MPKSSTVSIESLRLVRPAPVPPAGWTLSALAGCITELSESRAAAGLTLGFSIILDAQQRGELVAWLTSTDSSFFPPDAAAGGVDLNALVVVRLPTGRQIPRAAELLGRSGAFGLLVLDLGAGAEIPIPMQMRLVGLAQKHHTAILCLTRKGNQIPSLGSLVSLRGEATRTYTRDIGAKQKSGRRTFACTVQILKDKRRGPGWNYTEVCHGPDGLR